MRHTQIDHELHNLHDRDPLLPPDLDASRRLEVVPVHDDMDRQVERDRHPLHGGGADELGVAKKGGRAMVVAVEER